MKNPHVLLALTVMNLGLLAYQLLHVGPAGAQTDLGILRGSGIEIVDNDGHLRAQLKIEPANPDYEMPDGTKGYADTVIFRLITPDGKPRVKLTTAETGSGLMLLGSTDTTHTILEADGAETSLKLRNNETVEEILRP